MSVTKILCHQQLQDKRREIAFKNGSTAQFDISHKKVDKASPPALFKCVLCPTGQTLVVTPCNMLSAALLLQQSLIPESSLGATSMVKLSALCAALEAGLNINVETVVSNGLTAVDVFYVHCGKMTILTDDDELFSSALRCCGLIEVPTVFVLIRHRGGKGGFGKNLAKKGRAYLKAQRRRETNQDLQALARNLRGERIGEEGIMATRAPPQRRQEQSEMREAEEIRALQIAARHEQESRLAEREAFGKVVREAVLTGFRAVVAKRAGTGPTNKSHDADHPTRTTAPLSTAKSSD